MAQDAAEHANHAAWIDGCVGLLRASRMQHIVVYFITGARYQQEQPHGLMTGADGGTVQ